MTVIVGVIHSGTITMGSDTLMSAGFDKHMLASSVPKVFHRDPFLIGVTGSVRSLQLVRYKFDPVIEHRSDDMEFMATDFVAELRRVLKDGGVLHEENGIEHTGDREDFSTFLVGYRGHLYRIGADFSVTERADDFTAIGSGEDFALGSLHSTQGLDPETRIHIAIRAAMRFNGSVGGDVRIETLAACEAMENAA